MASTTAMHTNNLAESNKTQLLSKPRIIKRKRSAPELFFTSTKRAPLSDVSASNVSNVVADVQDYDKVKMEMKSYQGTRKVFKNGKVRLVKQDVPAPAEVFAPWPVDKHAVNKPLLDLMAKEKAEKEEKERKAREEDDRQAVMGMWSWPTPSIIITDYDKENGSAKDDLDSFFPSVDEDGDPVFDRRFLFPGWLSRRQASYMAFRFEMDRIRPKF